MAERTPRRSEKARLIAEIDAARAQLSDDVRSVVRAADVPSRMVRSLKQLPTKVAAGTAVASFVSTLLLGRKGRKGRPARHRKGADSSLLERALALVKPFLSGGDDAPDPGGATGQGKPLSGEELVALGIDRIADALRSGRK